MKKENILVIVLVCIAVAWISFSSQSNTQSLPELPEQAIADTADASSGIEWYSYVKGRELAKKQNKQIYLYFHADWCSACKTLKATTFEEEVVISYLKDNFISIAVDTDAQKTMAEKWGIRALPTHWFLESDGSKIDHLKGYLPKEMFMEALKFIQGRKYLEKS